MANKNQQDEIVYSSTGLQENTACVVSYLGLFFTGMFLIVFEENSKLVRFHAMQSILLFFTVLIVTGILNNIPFGWIVNILIAVVTIPLWFFLMVKGYRRERYKLPFYGQLSENILEKLDRMKKKS